MVSGCPPMGVVLETMVVVSAVMWAGGALSRS